MKAMVKAMVPGIRQVFICILSYLLCLIFTATSSSLLGLSFLPGQWEDYLLPQGIMCVCVCKRNLLLCGKDFIVPSTWWWVNNKMLPKITVCFAIIITRNIIFKSHDAPLKWSHHNLWGIKYFPIWNIDSYTAFALRNSFSIKVQQFKPACGDAQAETYSQIYAWRPFGGRWLDSKLILVAKEGLADSPPATCLSLQ